MNNAYIAVDFGGGSGRVIAGTIIGGRLTLDEVYRFQNRRVTLGNTVYWDFPALYADMIEGLRLAARKYRLLSVAIDTWGVDFGLIDARGNLVSNPVCYRDPAVAGVAEEYFSTHSAQEHYAVAGIQVMDINTMFRLIEFRRSRPELLSVAKHLLFMPDLFSYYLTEEVNCEYCIASTSELLDARKRNWNYPLIESLGLDPSMFPPIVMPGTVRGSILPRVREEIGVDYDVKVIAAGSHDTASAVYTAMTDVPDPSATAYLSSGTWSLLGVLTDNPVLTEQARTGGFTNEGGVGGKIRLLQNITGLWILQELMAGWKAAGEGMSYPELVGQSRESSCATVIDVDDPVFATSTDMQQTIVDYCRANGLAVPASKGDFGRCVMLSLADRYRRGIEALNAMLPEPVKYLRIIGGGSRNELLNELTGAATRLPIIAGPAEATAIGNILLQAAVDGVDTAGVDIDSD